MKESEKHQRSVSINGDISVALAIIWQAA